ncbi:MAG: type II secretion system F family protein [Nevskiales bacterium]
MDRKGQRLNGKMTAYGEAQVRASLRRQGINPVRIKQQSSLFQKRAAKIKGSDIAVFTRQMATMMKSGVPLVTALEMIARGNENPSMRKMVSQIKTDVESGGTLADALEKHPGHFDNLTVNLVRAGEKSGTLETLLDKIATYKEKTEALKAKIKKAMFYPAAVIAVAFIVTGILLYFVVPQFQSLFQTYGADLPAFTLFVMALSDYIQDWWWLVVITVVAVVVAHLEGRNRSHKYRRLTDRVLLKAPIMGEIIYKAAVARYARTLGTMFAAGVPLVETLDSVGKASGNVVFEESIEKMRDQVAGGLQLQLAMEQTNLFPHMAVQMIAIGEEAGSLDEMAAKVADFYEEEVDNMVDAMSSLLEPLIISVIGVMVGGLVVAMYMPIFKLASVF